MFRILSFNIYNNRFVIHGYSVELLIVVFIIDRESACISVGRWRTLLSRIILCLNPPPPLPHPAIHCIRPVNRDCEARDLHISACVWPIIMFHPVFNEWLHYRGPRHRGVDFLLLCALKNQPPTHVDPRAYSSRTHNARRAFRAFVSDVIRTQIRR